MRLIRRRGSGEGAFAGLERFFPMLAEEGITAIKDPQIGQRTWTV